jgi:hypothetical protein
MKKYILFLTSFAVFYGMFQIISGLILTTLHTPNFALMNTGISHEVAFGQAGNFPFMILLLIATLAYFFTQKLTATVLKRAFIKK